MYPFCSINFNILKASRFRSVIGVHLMQGQRMINLRQCHGNAEAFFTRNIAGVCKNENGKLLLFTIESIERVYAQCRPISNLMQRDCRLGMVPMRATISSSVSRIGLFAEEFEASGARQGNLLYPFFLNPEYEAFPTLDWTSRVRETLRIYRMVTEHDMNLFLIVQARWPRCGGVISRFPPRHNWTHRLGVDMMTAFHRRQTRHSCVESRLSFSTDLTNPVKK